MLLSKDVGEQCISCWLFDTKIHSNLSRVNDGLHTIQDARFIRISTMLKEKPTRTEGFTKNRHKQRR